MWIVRLALSRPYTFVVMAILIAILGGTAIVTMPVDIFPYIDIPVVSVLWVYIGLSPEEMEKRVVTDFERSLTSNVNDIEHIESQSYNGYARGQDLLSSECQDRHGGRTGHRDNANGAAPNAAGNVSGERSEIRRRERSDSPVRPFEQNSARAGNLRSRQQLYPYAAGTVQGASVSYPFGGKQRAVMVDLNLDELYAKQLSPIDVSNALNLQNLILPAGTAKLAKTEYQVRVNSSPVLLDELNNLPIKTVNGATVYMKDVAQVHDGFSGAEQYRPHEWLARRAYHHHAQRQSLDAVHRECRESRSS